MSAGRRWLAAAFVVVIAVTVSAALVRPSQSVTRTLRSTTASVGTATFVCPSVSGNGDRFATDMTIANLSRQPVTASYTALGAVHTPLRGRVHPQPSVVVHRTTPGAAVAVTATGPGAAGLAVSQVGLVPAGKYRGSSDIACAAATADLWFAGADGRIGTSDVLFISNPGATSANVALSLWSAAGPVSVPGVNSINVPAHAYLAKSIGDLAPDRQWVAVHVHANSGTVAAAIADSHVNGIRPAGGDWLPPTLGPSPSGVVTGFTGGARVDVLHLANPGSRDATVSIRIVTTTRNFVPAGHQSVVVPAGHTTSVNLSGAIGGEISGVAYTSDVPVVAEAVTVRHPTRGFDELAWLPSQPPLVSPAAFATTTPPFNQIVRLILTAPLGAIDVEVRAGSGKAVTVHVPSQRSTWIDLRAVFGAGATGPGPILLTPLGDQPVYAERLLYAAGAHGPLLAEEAATVLPRATVLPPAVADLRVVTRR